MGCNKKDKKGTKNVREKVLKVDWNRLSKLKFYYKKYNINIESHKYFKVKKL